MHLFAQSRCPRAHAGHGVPAIALALLLVTLAAGVAAVPSGAAGGPGVRPDGAPACSTGALWGFQTAQQFVPGTASGHPWGIDLVYVSAGTVLYALHSETVAGPGGHAGGAIAWQVPAPMGVTYQNDLVVADLSFGRGVVVLSTTSEGRVICLDALTGAIRWLSPRVRRATCGDDTAIAGPSVQLWDASDAAFRATVTDDDLVFLPTRYLCGTTTANRVYAFRASDGTTFWTFNAAGAFALDYASEGCVVDYGRNAVYCGTHAPPAAPGQGTLWALDSRSGARLWDRALGSIDAGVAMVRGGARLVAGAADGQLRGLDPATGATGWGFDATPGGEGFVHALRAGDGAGFDDHVWAVTGDGLLHAVVDPGGPGPAAPAWSTPGPAAFTTAPAWTGPGLGLLYAGTLDGRVHQVDAASGGLLAPVTIRADAAVTSVALDRAGAPGEPNRLVAAAGGRVRRHCLPWVTTVDVGDPPGEGHGDLPGLEAYPTPFRGSLRLGFRADTPGSWRLVILDLRGRVQRRLYQVAGDGERHDVLWDGNDDAGRAVPAGVYFARLERQPGAAGGSRVMQRAVVRLR